MRELISRQGAHGQRKGIVKYFFALPVVAVLFGLIFFTAPNAFAVDEYSCGTYGASNYGESCPADPVTPGDGGGSTSEGSGSTGGSGTTSKPGTSGGNTSTGGEATPTEEVMPTPTDGTILLNSFSAYSSKAGKTLAVKANEVIYFVVDGEKYAITVKSVSDDATVVTIGTDPTEITLKKGEVVNYDANGDGENDIALKYEGPGADGSGSVNFTKLTGAATDNEQADPAKTSEEANWWWLWIVIAIVGLLIIIITAVAAKRRKDNS